MKTNFLEKVLNNPKDFSSGKLISTISVKNIDPFTHDFDSESISDRLHSLYSILVCNTIDSKLKSILLKYRSELEFLKEANKKSTTSKKLQKMLENKSFFKV